MSSIYNQTVAQRLTRERLSSYLSETGGDLREALGLYDWNIRAGAADSPSGLEPSTRIFVRNHRLDVCRQQILDQGHEPDPKRLGRTTDAEGVSEMINREKWGLGSEFVGSVR